MFSASVGLMVSEPGKNGEMEEKPIGDLKMLASILRNGQEALVGQYDMIKDEMNMDDPQWRRANMPVLYCIGKVLECAEESIKTIASIASKVNKSKVRSEDIIPLDPQIQKKMVKAIRETTKMFEAEKARASGAPSQATQKQKSGFSLFKK